MTRAPSQAATPTRLTSRRLARLGYLLPIGALLAALLVTFAWWSGWDRKYQGGLFVLVYVVPIAVVIGIGLSILAIIRARREAGDGTGRRVRAAPIVGIGMGLATLLLELWLLTVLAGGLVGIDLR